ncbi:response regulator [Litorisediminicola beolgyonensis]|uniref:Response regulator n=1 Tax=Litorisediminicola beolgyonensis TaxID=1173614 RepID=A0ABW3ZDQ6_9RHOB
MNECLRGRRVLVLEDEAMIALDLRLTLEDHGAVVIGPADSLEDGLRLVQENRIDAAILDADLGEVDSLPLAQHLRANGVPFVFHTGCNRPEFSSEFAGAPVHLKPALPDSLAADLAALLSES